MLDPEYIRNAGFWEDTRCFAAGMWEGDLPMVPEGAVLFRTSGSTGEGKWLVLQKNALLLSASAANGWLGVDSGSVWGLCLPLCHVGGFGVVARAYSAGCGLAAFDGKWDACRFAKWVEAEGVSHVSLVPTQVHDLVRAKLRAPVGLGAVVVGGGRLSAELGQTARDAGWPVLASYGMTETCSQIATQEPELLRSPYLESPLKILPIWEVRRDGAGLLEVHGDALFSGSLVKRGSKWIFQKREPGWFKTNDRVTLNGDYLEPQGRADTLVKIMGELVDTEKVERRFVEMAGGRIEAEHFAVVAIPDPRREHVLVAVFQEGIPGAAECFNEYQKVASGVERFQKQVFVNAMPRTSLGKLKKGELIEIIGIRD